MSKSKIAGIITGGVVVAAVAFVVSLFLVKWLWGWTIPDLFPGAVEKGLVAETISWFTAMKIALFVAVLSAFGGKHHKGGHVEKS